ncbi:hypothetical protein FUSPEROL_02215 [Fusobacterium periodonticum ATCC 33693]|uniref:Uncharacterized protein n=1 Tax=Fusobacterium periodonticum ATCC 33693 TaxID=546275 RepID=D4CXL8_9FUSO|nr:hypothetical protein FUSPEROL_02215 [Fusobacterium periodonticum ATCC 33693]
MFLLFKRSKHMYTKKDLKEAIKHCKEKIKELKCGKCKDEHEKLLEMLIDLELYRDNRR